MFTTIDKSSDENKAGNYAQVNSQSNVMQIMFYLYHSFALFKNYQVYGNQCLMFSRYKGNKKNIIATFGKMQCSDIGIKNFTK